MSVRSYHISVLLLPVLAVVLNGCFLYTSSQEGDAIKKEMQLLNERFVKIEDDAVANRENLAAMIETAQAQVVDMEDTLSRATRVLARNSADFGAEMEEVKNEIMLSRGAVAEINHALEGMKAAVEATNNDVGRTDKRVTAFALAAGLDLPVDEAKVPKDARSHFQMIKDSLSAGRFGETRALARLYQTRHGAAANQDEVQMLIAQSYVAQKRYAKSLGALRRFVDVHAKSKHMAQALYEMANAFYKLGDCTDARILVDTVIGRYKTSTFARKAAELLKRMDADPAKCTS